MALQLVVIAFGLAVALLDPGSGLARLGATVLFSLAFLCFPIWASLWRMEITDRRLWLLPAGIAPVAMAALLSTPAALRSAAWLPLPAWSPHLVVLAPLLTWGCLYWLGRGRPGFLAGLGLVRARGVPHQLAIGLAVGAALGFHLVAATVAAPPLPSMQPPGLPGLAWSLLYGLGVRAVGQELVFRGLLFGLLSRGQPVQVGRTFFFIIALNVLVFSASTFGTADPESWLLLLVYEGVFATLATGLRNYYGTIWPSLAMSVIYQLFTAGMLR